MPRELLALAIAAFLIALCSVTFTSVIRALVPDAWLLKKPWGCDLCMSVWTSLLAGAIQYFDQGEWAWMKAVLPAIAISLFILSRLHQAPEEGPPEIPS